MNGTLKVACAQVPTALDREQAEGLFQWENKDAHLQVYEPLLTYSGRDPDDPDALTAELAPLAALSCEASAGGRVYRITLRPGVRSSVGNELTAEDIVWTFQRSLSLGTVGAWVIGRAGITDPSQIRAVSTHEIDFALPTESTLLPHLLTVMVPAIIDSQEVRVHTDAHDPWAVDWLRTSSAGFGPYVARDPGDGRIRFESNPRYWQGPPAFSSIEFLAYPEADKRWEALRDGVVGAATDLEVDAGHRNGAIVHALPTAWRVALALNCTTAPFNQVAARQAVAWAIPYDRLITDAFRGRARRMTSCLPDLVWGHTITRPSYQYEPARAREILRGSAPMPMPPVRVLYHTGLPMFGDVAATVAQSLREIGLDVSLVGVSEAEHDRAKVSHTFEIVVDHFGPQVMDARYPLGHDVNPPLGGVFDITGYHNEEIATRLAAAERELDESRTRKLVSEVQQIAMTDLPWVPLAQQTCTLGVSGRIRGYRWYPLPRLRCRDLSLL